MMMTNYTDDYLFVKKRGVTLRIPIHEIRYIESGAHKLYVHVNDDTYDYNDKMENVAELLKERGFIRCHQSYLVNKSYVSGIRYDKLKIGDKEVRISRKYKDNVKSNFSGEDNSSSGKIYIAGKDNNNRGCILCISGPYTGKRFELVPEQKITIGRDGNVCEIVINIPKVSRQHLNIIYHKATDCYEVTDMSTNGTYINNDIRLEKNERYEVEAGETIGLGDGMTEFKLL